MKRERQSVWNKIRKLALGLGLPHVEETTSYGQPTLKAHGKLWVWWSPHEDAVVFKVSPEERDMLIDAEPDTFFLTDHYRGSAMILMQPEKVDEDWVEANLRRVWRELAPKRLLRELDASNASRPPPGSRRPRPARRR